VERSTRFLMLLHISDRVGASEAVLQALCGALSAGLRRTLTWVSRITGIPQV
jgi:hypothetical protein